MLVIDELIFCPWVFVPKITTSPGTERTTSLSTAWLTLQPSSSFRFKKKKKKKKKKKNLREYCHDQPIDRIGPLQPPVKPSKGQSGVLQETWPLDFQAKYCSTTRIPSLSITGRHPRPTGSLVGGGVYPSAEVQSAYSTAPADRAISRERQMMVVVVEGWRLRCWSFKLLGHISKFCPQKDPLSAAVSTATTATTTATITTATISSTTAKESGQV